MALKKYMPHYRATLRLGMPIVVGQLGTIVLGFADTLMVGHYNTSALAAASFVNSLYNLVTIALLGFSYGITPIVGAMFSRGEEREAGAAVRTGIIANGLFCGGLMAAMLVLYFLLPKLGQPVELLPLIRPYYLVILISMAFVAAFNVMRQFTDAITQTDRAMWLLVGGNVLNIVGNWMLIYGIGPFPELGLFGAGLSTLLSRVLMAVGFVWLLLSARKYATFREGFRDKSLCGCKLRKMFATSLPVALQMGMETGAFSVSAVMVGWLGAVALASYQVLMTISTLGYLFYYSIGAAIAIRVAAFSGSGDREGVRTATAAGYHTLLAMSAVTSIFLSVAGGWLISCFTSDAAVIASATALIMPLVLYQFGDATQICYANALRGTSYVKPMIWCAFVSYILVGLPTAFLLGFPAGLGERGIFLSFSAALFTAAGLFYWQFRRAVGARY